MDSAVAIALRANFDVLAARLRVDSAHAERRIAGAFTNPTAAVVPAVPYQYSLAAPVDVWPQRAYRVQAGSLGASAAVLDRRDTERLVRFEVRVRFANLLLAHQFQTIADESRDIMVQLLAADSVRLRAGDIPERDVAQTELELVRAEAARAAAAAVLRGARLDLQAAMGVAEPDPAFAIAGSLDYRPIGVPLDSLMLGGVSSRPDLAAAQTRVEQSSALHALAGAQVVPVPTVGVVWQPTGPFPNGEHVALSLGLAVPVFNWFGGERERAAAGEASARVAAARAGAQARAEILAAEEQFRAARELAERYERGLLAKTQAALENARYAYGAGAISLLELLNSVRTFGAVRADYYTALHDYWVSVYALCRAAGREVAP